MNLNRESHVNQVAVRARLFDQAEFEVKIRNPLRRVPKVVPYEAGAIDRDNDMLVQEGTIWERPAGSRFITKLGRELAAGLRSIPSASRLVDGNGKEIDYKPGDRSMGARGRERRLAGRGQRRLRRADRRLARADRQEARASEIENLDELIGRIDAAASEGSRERLLAAEAARGDESMDEDYRSFWDALIEGWTGVNQQHNRGSGPTAEIVRALKATRKLEGERRQAGDAAGNAPDRDRESEFDEIGLPDGVDLEEHERRMREEPEYREAFIESLIAGEMDVPGQEEAAEEATEDVAEAVEDLVPEADAPDAIDPEEARRRAAEFGPDDLPETPESQGGGPPDPEADLPDDAPQRPRMRPEAREYLLTQADSDAIHAIIRDEDDGFLAAGLRIDNMDAETRAEWRELASWESRRRTVAGMSDEELEQDLETIRGWAENEPGREQWLAFLTAERDRRAIDADAAPEGRGYEFTGQDPNNPWENFNEEGNGRRHEIIRNLSPEERAQIVNRAAAHREDRPDGTDAVVGWPEAAGPEPDEEGLFVAAAYAEEFQRYNNFVGEGDLAARLRRDGAGGVAPATPGDTDPREDTRIEIDLERDDAFGRWQELQEIIAEQRRERQPLDQQPDPELVREFEELDERFGPDTSGGEGIPAIKFVNWDSPLLDPESRRNRRESIANLNDAQRAEILNDVWPTEALGPRPNKGGVSRAKRYVRMHMGDEGREAGRPEDLGDGLEELDRSGLAERIVAAVQADPVGDNEDRGLMRRFADRHAELMAEMEGDDVSRFHRGRMEILGNMDDAELAEHIERQRNHIINFNDSGDVLRRRTAASELARAVAMRDGREAFDRDLATPEEGSVFPRNSEDREIEAQGWQDEARNLLNQIDDWEKDQQEFARDLAGGLGAIEGNEPENRERREFAALLQSRLDNDGRDPTGMWAVGELVDEEPDPPDSGVDEVPEIPPVPELSDVPTDIEPINQIRQHNRRRDNNVDVVTNYKRDIKEIQRKLGTRNGVPTWRNDGHLPNGLERLNGHEANVDRALADIDRRLALLPRRGESEEKRKLQGLKRSLRNLKNNKIPAERNRRQLARDAERRVRQDRHRDLALAHIELRLFNRNWNEAGLDGEIANNPDDAAVLAQIDADLAVLDQYLPNLRVGNWDPDEGEAPADMNDVRLRAREIRTRLRDKKKVVNKRQIFRENRVFVDGNETRFREIEAHINGLPDDADISVEMATELNEMRAGISALRRMGHNNPDPDLQALIDRKVALDRDITSLINANGQRINAPVVRGALEGFDPRLGEIRAALDNADEAFENQIDVHLAEVQAMISEMSNLPNVGNLTTLNEHRRASKAALMQLNEDLISFRRNVVLGPRGDIVEGGVAHDGSRILRQRLGGGENPRSRPAGLGLPGQIDDAGNVVIDSVPVGNRGMNTQLDADRFVRGGGDLSDVPDSYLGNAIMANAGGLDFRDGEANGPFAQPGADIGDNRFLLVSANGGNVGTTYVFAQRRPDGSIGKEGVFIKIAKHQSGVAQMNGDYDQIGEMFAVEVGHRLGLPMMPGREDGEMLGRGSGGFSHFAPGETGRAIVLEHALNLAEDFDDLRLTGGFHAGSYTREQLDAVVEGRVDNLLLNYFLGVSDRHAYNGLLSIETVTDANGNQIHKGHVYPIDLAWVGKRGKTRVSQYHSATFSMDGTLLDDIRRIRQADPDRKAELRAHVTEMLTRLQDMINDPNLRERMINRQEFYRDVDAFRQALNTQFNKIAPNGVVPVDEILTDLGLT